MVYISASANNTLGSPLKLKPLNPVTYSYSFSTSSNKMKLSSVLLLGLTGTGYAFDLNNFNLRDLVALDLDDIRNIDAVEALKARQTTSLDLASILSEAYASSLSSKRTITKKHSSLLTAKFPSPSTTVTLPFITPGGNLLQPPASLVGAIITAVPASVLVDLAQPSLRSSIASEFKAGNTPAWYQSLPAGVKSYIEALNTQINAGDINLSATPTSNFQFPVTTMAAAGTVGTGTGSAGPGGVFATSSSKAWAEKAMQTGGPLGLSFAAAVGVLGVAIAL